MILVAGVASVLLAAAPITWFSDATGPSNIPVLRHSEAACAVDLDGDNLPDLFLPNVRAPSRIFINKGGLKFSEERTSAGVGESGGVAAAVGDVNGDGRPDLYVARGAAPYAGPNVLYVQKDDKTFEDVSESSGVRARDGGLTVALADFDGDGDLDSFLPGWSTESLFLNDGKGHYSDHSEKAGFSPPGRGWASVVFDFDGDARPDIFVCRGSFDNQHDSKLYRNLGGNYFADVTQTAGLSSAPWSLGPVSADFDGDGDFDLYLAGYAGKGKLFRNDGNGHFTDVTPVSGLTASLAVGAAAGPIDGDLLPDLVVAGFGGPVRLFKNLGDMRFSEVTENSGLLDFTKNEGLTLADFDGDGDLDLYVTNLEGQNRLYRNTLDDPGYLKVKLLPGSVKVGSVARLYHGGKVAATEEISSGGPMGQGPMEFLFRLLPGKTYDLEVFLPGRGLIKRESIGPGTLTLP